MKKLIIPDVETFIAAIQDEISQTPESRYFHQLHVVLRVLQGASSYEAARLYRHSPRTVSRRLFFEASLGELNPRSIKRRLIAFLFIFRSKILHKIDKLRYPFFWHCIVNRCSAAPYTPVALKSNHPLFCSFLAELFLEFFIG